MWPQNACVESHFICMHETAILLRICDHRREIKSCCFETNFVDSLALCLIFGVSRRANDPLELESKEKLSVLVVCFATSANLFFKHSTCSIYFSINESVSHLSNSLFRMLLCFRSKKLIIHKLIKISRFTFDCLATALSSIFLHNAFLFWFPFFSFVVRHTEKCFRKRKFHCLGTQTINCWKQ